MALDLISRTLREQAQKECKPLWGRQPHAANPLPAPTVTHSLSSPGKHLADVASDPGATELYGHVSSEIHSEPQSRQSV